MPAPKGNRFWEMRSTHGRSPIFKSADELWDAACQYFEWTEDNPIITSELVKFHGEASVAELPKMRAMTIQGLCLFLDIDEQTLANYEKKKDFFGVVTKIKTVIYQQKFTGAAANELNPNIIARDLGLVDKTESKETHEVNLKAVKEDFDDC